MDEIRQVVVEMKVEENRLLELRTNKTQSATRQAMDTIIVGIPLAFYS